MIRRRSKYRAAPTVLNGRRFDSKREAEHALSLQLMEQIGDIRGLRFQVAYPLEVNGHLVARYVADFVYDEWRDGAWWPVVADAKGVKTPVYRLKAKLMQAIYGIDIREV